MFASTYRLTEEVQVSRLGLQECSLLQVKVLGKTRGYFGQDRLLSEFSVPLAHIPFDQTFDIWKGSISSVKFDGIEGHP